MKHIITTITIASILTGCYSLPPYMLTCSHTDQPVYKFERFTDGHYFLFGRNSKLIASVNTKEGVLYGKFEIYYQTGILKSWGMLDAGGHVVSGNYNKNDSDFDNYYIRSMTVADQQNTQTELVNIMKTGIIKEAESGQDDDKTQNQESAVPTLIDCTHSSFSPVIGNVYKHDGEFLQVFQVVEDGIMVRGDLNIFVETSKQYVDDEMLSAGQYEYVGPWTYETIEKKHRTIRRFKQVD